jgi:hypothetical protein
MHCSSGLLCAPWFFLSPHIYSIISGGVAHLRNYGHLGLGNSLWWGLSCAFWDSWWHPWPVHFRCQEHSPVVTNKTISRHCPIAKLSLIENCSVMSKNRAHTACVSF